MAIAEKNNTLTIGSVIARFSGALFLTPAFVLATVVAYWLRFETEWLEQHIEEIKYVLPVAVVVKFAVFGMLRMTRSWHDYVSFTDLLRMGKATAISAAFLVLADAMYRVDGVLPRSIIVIDSCLTAIFVGSMLSARRMFREWNAKRKSSSEGRESVLMIGLNDTCDAILRATKSQMQYHVAGLVAQNAKMLGREINGVPVVATLSGISQAVRDNNVEAVLVVGGELQGAQFRELIEDCQSEGVKLRVLPSVDQIVSGKVSFRPRDVDIEDLLGREPVSLEKEQIEDWLNDRVLMVTGSCGSIGSEIARQLLQFQPKKLVLVDRSECGQFELGQELQSAINAGKISVVLADINDRARMQDLIDQYQPTIMFHAAAYKHVPLMEEHPTEAVKNITKATCGLVELAHENDFESFVMISTDKAVNPTNVMGCCKRVAELYVQSKARHSRCRFVTVRFGNVLGSAGSVVPTFKRQILAGGPVTVTHPKMERYFMTIPEASQLVIQAGALGKGGEIFVLDMGDPVRIVELAEDLIRLSGLKVGEDIEIVYTGLRPGEKMYEELYIENEQRQPTVHPKILVAESEQLEFSLVLEQTQHLAYVAQHSAEDVRRVLKEIVPRYQARAEQTLKAA